MSRLTGLRAVLTDLRDGRSRWMSLTLAGVLASMLIPTISSAQTPPISEGVVCNTNKTSSFVLTATNGYISTPDGNSLFMWGYGLGNNGFQYVGPILCANEGDNVTITLKNTLPVPTSLNLVGLTGVKANGATASYDPATNSLTTAAAPGGTVTYTFVADHPGTFTYESGTNPQLQVLMGLVGAFIVRPTHVSTGYNGGTNTCPAVPQTIPVGFVYDDCSTAYSPSHEFMHLLTEIDPHMHHALELATCQQLFQANGSGGAITTDPTTGAMTWTPPPGSGTPLVCTPATFADPNLVNVYDMTQYKPRYWMINGRSFPDTLVPNFTTSVPTQPYGALVHILPSCPAPDSFQGSTTIQCPNPNPTLSDGSPNPDYNPLPGLVRFLNGGPVAYPFHPHGDHDSELGLDGRVLVNPTGGPGGTPVNTSIDRFDVVVPPGQTIDTTFGWVDAQQWDPNSSPLTCPGCPPGIGVAQPQQQNLITGPYWSGSPFLGQKLPLTNGITQWNQCGEYYHFAHSHALFQVTNYGAPGGGMLTFIRVDPPPSLQKRYGTTCDGGMGWS
jgi:hypothetical protein